MRMSPSADTARQNLGRNRRAPKVRVLLAFIAGDGREPAAIRNEACNGETGVAIYSEDALARPRKQQLADDKLLHGHHNTVNATCAQNCACKSKRYDECKLQHFQKNGSTYHCSRRLCRHIQFEKCVHRENRSCSRDRSQYQCCSSQINKWTNALHSKNSCNEDGGHEAQRSSRGGQGCMQKHNMRAGCHSILAVAANQTSLLLVRWNGIRDGSD